MRTASAVLLLAGLSVAGGTALAEPGSSDVRDVDWHNATFTVPSVGSCPQQQVRFSDGTGSSGDHVYRFTPDEEIGYADVNGDRVEDALILLDCGPQNSEYTTGLIAMTTDEDGESVRPLGVVVDPPTWTQYPFDFTVWYGDIAVAMGDYETGQTWTEYYRWAPSAGAFVRVDGQ
ncbi:hypothetical protein [Saccharopolyspora rectivirgula]|uniref:hypothetical protein n=1 Tax=Saccharopolyspora rectivirgula TaxID=28042 RepID=UPI00041E27EF|nr:hypothetical protein [Saccharopolyspora rectivirgula]